MPATSERQRKLAAAKLARKRAGKSGAGDRAEVVRRLKKKARY